MLDWFVLLIPLVLLPILLLFVFVGCTLDKTGLPGPPAIPITFEYPGGLDTDVLSLTVKFEVTLQEEGAVFEAPVLFDLIFSEASGNPINPDGAKVDGPKVSVGAVGTVKCTCQVSLILGGAQPPLEPVSKPLTGDGAVSFTLLRVEDEFILE